MGLFGGLFGGGKGSESESRCMECGMTGGDHTDWCPEVHEPSRPVGVAADEERGDAADAREVAGDEPREG